MDATAPIGIDGLMNLVARRMAQAEEDPFGNPVMSVALSVTRQMDEGELDVAVIAALVRELRDEAFADRARRLAAYVGGTGEEANLASLGTVAQNVLRPDPNDSPVPWALYRSRVERARYAAVFTAHPTFSLAPEVNAALAEAACGVAPPTFASHRPPPITLEQEFARAAAAIANGRDALDRLTRALLLSARSAWPERWTELTPRPIILTSWVGYDTDGRTDIGWADTLRLRLRMKKLQLERLHAQLAALPHAGSLAERVAAAAEIVRAQEDACVDGNDPVKVAAFAHLLVAERDVALTTPQPLLELFTPAIASAEGDEQLALCVARAGLVSHGLSLAHTHVRLNSTQLHNVVRQRLGIIDAAEDPSHRRALLGAINLALDTVQPVPVDFGGLIAEQASAARLMMVVAQIVKHVDASVPVRFLIAETESGTRCSPPSGSRACSASRSTSRSVRCSRLPKRSKVANACSRKRCAVRIGATTSRARGDSRFSSDIRIPAAMSARPRRAT